MNNHCKPIHVKTRAAALAIVEEHEESAWFYIEDEHATKYISCPTFTKKFVEEDKKVNALDFILSAESMEEARHVVV